MTDDPYEHEDLGRKVCGRCGKEEGRSGQCACYEFEPEWRFLIQVAKPSDMEWTDIRGTDFDEAEQAIGKAQDIAEEHPELEVRVVKYDPYDSYDTLNNEVWTSYENCDQ